MMDIKIKKIKVNNLGTDAASLAAYEDFPTFRKEALERIKNEPDKRRHIGASLLLGQAMKEAGLAMGEVPCYNQGKLYFPQGERFYVNLSHAGDYAVIAIAEQEVGIDLEPVRPRKLSVVRRVCSDEGYQAYLLEEAAFCGKDATQPQHEGEDCAGVGTDITTWRQDLFFTTWWTKQEAIAKLTGEGLGRLLREEAGQSQSGDDIIVETQTFLGDAESTTYVLSVAYRG